MKHLLFILILIFSFSIGYSSTNQEKIDSLLKVLPTVKSDTAKISLLINISNTYRLFETKNATKYCDEAIALSQKIENTSKLYDSYIVKGLIFYRIGKNEEAITLYKEIIANTKKATHTKGKALVNLGNVYASIGKYDSSIIFYNQAIKIFEITNNKKYIANTHNNIGTNYSDIGEFDKAIAEYTLALHVYEESNNLEGEAAAIGNIGIIYYFDGNYKKALENFEKALAIQYKTDRKDKVANTLANIASMHGSLGDLEKSVATFKEAEAIVLALNDVSRVASINQNLSPLYFELNKHEEGIAAINKAINIYHDINEPKGEGGCYISLGTHYYGVKDYKNAIISFNKALNILEPIGVKHNLRELYHNLAETFNKNGEYQKSTAFYQKYIAINDSLTNSEKTQQIAEMQEKYDSEQKEKEIKLQKIEIEKQHVEVAYQNKQKIGLGIGLFLALILLFVAYRSYQQKKKANHIISEQKAEVEEKNKEITDSINYAKRIQSAISPTNTDFKKHLPNSFVLYKPKDIVAGDFYWMESLTGDESRGMSDEKNTSSTPQNSALVLFAAADCTGHGVPGAMVSVVCNNALNRSVREHGLSQPNEILNKSREIVMQEFEKSDEDVQDGMDIALCSLNGNILQYAGAHNPLWIIRSNSVISSSDLLRSHHRNEKYTLMETKANKQPIGKFSKPQPFTNHQIELQKGDSIYIFSDGIVDQFGGVKGKKFKSKAFKELLLSIQHLSMEEQKLSIDTAFETWKGNLEQIDDVCVIGIKI